MNKKITILLFLLPLLLIDYSCKKANDLINFGFNIQSSFAIPPGAPINTPIDLPSFPMDYNSAQTFENHDTRADLVKKITLEYMKLNITSPAGEDFSFLKDVELRLAKDGMDDLLVAWKYNISDSIGTELSMDVTDQPLDAYLKSDGSKMKLHVTTDKLTTKEIDVSSDIRIRVTANLFK
ncbi:MAG: hypothetical protein GC180_04160 [Bacteroidetes bacterium]|nr:hypothetical protein [Bacteroidota bacterium]